MKFHPKNQTIFETKKFNFSFNEDCEENNL